ncbi:MAG: Hsp20/alpha crystallin family protein [Candidatus Sulfotelmatobacter sp.]
MLRPVSIAASEFPDRFSVLANVLGFEANELNVSVEPNRISIRGRKKINRSVAAEKAPPADFYPDQMLRMVDISSDVDPAGAVIELQSGILKFELPKVPKPVEKAVGAGKA